MKREDYIIFFSYHHCPILVIWTFGCFQTCVGTLFSSEAYAYMMSCHLLGGAIVSLSIEADGAESVDWLFKRVKIHTEPALSWNSFLDPIFFPSHRETVSVSSAIIVIFCDFHRCHDSPPDYHPLCRDQLKLQKKSIAGNDLNSQIYWYYRSHFIDLITFPGCN